MLTASDLEWVLEDLSATLGISLYEPQLAALRAASPTDVDGIGEFAHLVLEAGGIERSESVIHRQVCDLVLASFRRAALRSENMDLFVLDALANDIEGFEDILQLINHDAVGWKDYIGRSLSVSDVASTLLRLMRDRKVEACLLSESGNEIIGAGEGVVPPVPLEQLWYRMTSRGRMVHAAWASSGSH